MTKGNMMQPAAIQAMATETRDSSRLYSKNNDAGDVVKALVTQLAAELAQMPRKIDLRDEDMIVRVAVAYVDACAKSGAIPSKIGFCRACGLSRQAVDYFMKHHSDEPSAERLRMIFDSFAEMLNSAALAGACREITAIFLAKALYSYSEHITINTEINQDPLGERKSAADMAAIASRYDDIPGGLPD